MVEHSIRSVLCRRYRCCQAWAGFAAILLLGAFPATAADGFDGRYRQAIGADCSEVGVEGGALAVRGDQLIGVESRCTMKNGEALSRLDAVVYDMECEGEGTAWTARAIFMHAANGGLILAWRGYAFAYDRCPGPVPPPRVRPKPRPES